MDLSKSSFFQNENNSSMSWVGARILVLLKEKVQEGTHICINSLQL